MLFRSNLYAYSLPDWLTSVSSPFYNMSVNLFEDDDSSSGVTYCTDFARSGGYYVYSFGMTDGTHRGNVIIGQTSGSSIAYFDKTSTVINLSPGAEITSFGQGSMQWMNGYLYIDFDKNGVFEYNLNEDGTPAENSELISYTYFNGKNSKGESVVQPTSIIPPSFVLPVTTPAGEYRARFMVDYENIEPCAVAKDDHNNLVVDFTIQIIAPTAERTITLVANPEEGGTLVGGGTSIGAIVCQAIPAKGFDFINWTLDGEAFSTDLSFTDDTEGDKTYVANFAPKTDYPTMSYYFHGSMNQLNRYLKTVTALVDGESQIIFDAETEEDLPVYAYTGSFSAAGAVTDGALLDKTATKIVVPFGTTSIDVNFKAWTDVIVVGSASCNAELQWSQQALYIDWNNNYDFTDEGDIYPKNGDDMPSSDFQAAEGYTRTIQIPEKQLSGVYRMRVCYQEPTVNASAWNETLFNELNPTLRSGRAYDFEIEIGPDPTPYYTVSASPAVAEQGIVTVNGVESPISIVEGGSVNLVAIRNDGYLFEKWTNNDDEDAVVSTSANLTINDITADINYTAHFIASNSLAPMASTSSTPKWYSVRISNTWGSDERAGRYAYNDGTNVLSAEITDNTELMTDAYLWRFDGDDINSVKFVNKLDGKALTAANTTVSPIRVDFKDIEEADLWKIDLEKSSLENARVITNLGGNGNRFFNPQGSAAGTGFENWGFGVFAGGENRASAMFIYPIFNKIITIEQDVIGGRYGVETEGNYSYDLIDSRSVELIANPITASIFKGWSTDGGETIIEGSDVSPYVITAESLDDYAFETYTPVFEIIVTYYTVDVTISGNGNVTINDEETTSKEVEEGETVTLVATPKAGNVFVNWVTADGTEISAEPTLVINDLNANIAYTACFEPIMHMVTITVDGEGSVKINGESVTSKEVEEYSTVTIVAIPAADNMFVKWVNDADGTEVTTATLTLENIDAAANYTVYFKSNRHTLTTSKVGMGSIYIDGEEISTMQYVHGSSVILWADPADGYKFVNWTDEEGNEISTEDEYIIPSIESDMHFIANFASATSIISTSETTISAFVRGESIVVRGASFGATITLYTSNGVVVTNLISGNDDTIIDVADMKGVFIVRVANQVVKVVK